MKYFLKTFYLILLFLSIITTAEAQQKFTISGFVKDATTGETIIGANVYLQENLRGTTTNLYGFYSLTMDKGNYTLVVSFVGYYEKRFQIVLENDLRMNVNLLSKMIEMKVVDVVGDRKDENIQSTTMGRVEMDMEQIKQLPAFMGEVDAPNPTTAARAFKVPVKAIPGFLCARWWT